MTAEHKHLVEQGAPLIELRLDYIRGKVNIKRLVADRPGPVIMTCRRKVDGGLFEGTEEERQLLLRTSIAEGAEYVDLEEDVATLVPRFGKTRRIVSVHDFRQTPADLREIHERLCGLDPDIVKIATLANVPHDNVRMLELMRDSRVPTVGLCMGDIGTPSRILAAKFSAPFTYSTFHHERTLAPGQLSYQQMTEVYHYNRIDAETEVYGVIGDPIGHSYSPLIHNAAFRHLGMNKVYVPLRIPRGEVDRFLEDAPRLGIRGLSVTIPHKESVIRKLTKVDGAVRGVGAANTVIWRDEQMVGYNTDYRAAMDSLEAAFSTTSRPFQNSLRGRKALLLGAGGVARAIAHGLKRREAEVTISSRTAERADQLAQRVGCKAVDWSVRHGVSADIVINGTPIGMHPNVDETPYEKHHLKPSMVVFDTVYNPESTLLVKDARSRSCTVVTGVDMFIRQAALQFQLFTDQEAPADVMRETLRRAIAAVKY